MTGSKWQSFTAGTTGTLVGAKLAWGSADGTSNWRSVLSIYQGEGTSGTLLSTQTVVGDGVARQRMFALNTPVTVTAGNIYTIFMEHDIPCSWHFQYTDVYAGGRSNISATYDYWFCTYLDSGTVLPALTVQPGTGYVGIGVTAPTYRLQLPNTASAAGQGQANSWVTYSSARWKTNVKTIDNALDKVEQLRGVYYNWKPEQGGKHDIGFVAEEVGKVLPEVVSWDADGKGVTGMDYARVNALLVEAIKEQQKQMDAKDARISDLEKRDADLQKQIDAS